MPYQIECTLEGVVPMMQDRYFNPEELENPKQKGKDAWKKELPHKAYIDKKGLYVPSDNIRMMLIGNKHRPGAAAILGSYIETKKKTEYVSLCKGCIWVVGPDDPQKVYVDPKRKTYDDYDERSFINANGSRSLTRRPIVKAPWRLTFIIQVTDDRIDETKVRELFDVAGLRCGVGAYGPTFGRCVVAHWQVIEQAKKAK